MTRDKAQRLADRIERYWYDRGITVEVRVGESGIIRSNLTGREVDPRADKGFEAARAKANRLRIVFVLADEVRALDSRPGPKVAS